MGNAVVDWFNAERELVLRGKQIYSICSREAETKDEEASLFGHHSLCDHYTVLDFRHLLRTFTSHPSTPTWTVTVTSYFIQS